MISANDTSLEGVDYATAVQVLRDSGQTVKLVVKRRVVMPAPINPNNVTNNATSLSSCEQLVPVSLSRNRKKEDFGLILGCKIYVKDVVRRSVAEKDGQLHKGDLVHKINGIALEGLTLKEARKLVETAKDRLDLVVKRDPSKPKQQQQKEVPNNIQNIVETTPKQNGFPPASVSLTPPRPPMPATNPKTPVEDGKYAAASFVL